MAKVEENFTQPTPEVTAEQQVLFTTDAPEVHQEDVPVSSDDVIEAPIDTAPVPASTVTDSKKKGGLYLAAGGAIAALAGIVGMSIAGGGSDEAPVKRVVAEATPNTDASNPTETTTAPIKIYPTPVAPPEKLTSPEQLPDAPVYPIADDPQMLMNILGHNRDGWYNTGVEEYLENYTSDAGASGLTADIRQRRQVAEDYQSSYPTYRESTEVRVISHDFSNPDRRVIVAEVTMSAEFEERDHYFARHELIPKVVYLADGTEEIGWFVYSITRIDNPNNR